jgi:RNA polymerase sigma-70 factor (family 1)
MTNERLGDEKTLVLKISGGDKHAFTTLFNFYERFVYAYGKKITRSDELAAEIVQDIFLKIWLAREKMAMVENFGAYLNRLVRNHSLNVLRELAQQSKYQYTLKEKISEMDESTLQQIDYNETSRILNDAIAQLPAQQHLVYKLCHLEGLKYNEVAERLNISSETVRAHMKQALKRIREHFKKHAVAYPLLFLVLFK